MNITCFKVKIGEVQHISQLQKEGLVYCNTLKYFTEIEDGKVRGDKDEDAFEFRTFKDPQLLLKPVSEPDSKFKRLDITWGQMITRIQILMVIYSVSIASTCLRQKMKDKSLLLKGTGNSEHMF